MMPVKQVVVMEMKRKARNQFRIEGLKEPRFEDLA